MPYANHDGVRLFYEATGPSDADAVTFVEGLSYGTWMWRRQRERLSDDYRTLAWDNRGTGESDEPEGPYSVAQMAADLEAVLDDAGVERTHLVGASLGGMIALRYAFDYGRASSLVLLCTSPGGAEAVSVPEETRERMADVPDDDGRAEAIRHRMKPAFTDEFWTGNPEFVDQIVDWRLETDPSDEAYQWQSAAAARFDVADRLDEIRDPTLVLHGTADRVVPVENGRLLAEGIPDAGLRTFDGGSHLFFLEEPDRATGTVRRFLADV